MNLRRAGALCVVLSALVSFASMLCAQEEASRKIILDTVGFWRFHYTITPPVVRKEDGVEQLRVRASWLTPGTPLPPENWTSPDFDDSGWTRLPGVFNVSPNYHVTEVKSPFMQLECMRGKFAVTDPAAVKDLTLSAAYRGGIVVYVNGKEVARRHVGADGGMTAPAEDYPFEAYDPKKPETKNRSLADVNVPAEVLRKGVNVLAIEVHRSPYQEQDVKRGNKGHVSFDWGSCGLMSVRLTAAGEGIVANVERPEGLQVWNSDPMQVDCDLDFGDPNEPLRSVRIVGTPNGAFSGKVVAGSREPIKGLVVTMSDLKSPDGATVAASCVQVRYAKADWHQAGTQRRYMEYPWCFSGLYEQPSAEVSVTKEHPRPWSFKPTFAPGVLPSCGAVQPVWITVNVPAEAKPGKYAGTLTLCAEGQDPVKVPVLLEVCGWRLPDPKDYVTWVDIIESPESVAMQYDVPFWSDAHFRYLDRSMKMLGEVGNKVVYLHLIAETNVGNAETMVRWIAQPAGGYKYDFTPMERYIDLAVRRLGKPSVMVLYVHDYHLNKSTGGRHADPQATKEQKEKSGAVPVTALKPDGTTGELLLPPYDDPASEALWQPVIDRVRSKLKEHGLESAMMLGMSSDYRPDEFVVNFFKEMCPGTPWVNQGHGSPSDLYGVPVAYASDVWRSRFLGSGQKHGWRIPPPEQLAKTPWGERNDRAHHPRNEWGNFPVNSYRLCGELCIGGNRMGFARFGADFWPVVKDKRGRASRLMARYPKTSWRNLDIRTCLFEAGPDGAIGTHRFEMLREGVQECEARIFIERAILDGKIDGALAERCQNVLDDRITPIRIGTSLLADSADSDVLWWEWPNVLGYEYFIGSGWQDRSAALYSAAAEVAAELNK